VVPFAAIQLRALVHELSHRAGTDVEVVELEELRPGRIARANVREVASGATNSLVIKAVPHDSDFAKRRAQFETELNSLRFLNEVCPEIVPILVAWDLEAGILVLEELHGLSLPDLLLGESAATATEGLLAFARVLGRLHRATAGRDQQFYALRNSIGPVDRLADRFFLRNQDLREMHRESARILTEATLPEWSNAANAEFASVIASLAEPGEFLAFSNGDPCPGNEVLTEDGLVLLDFEVGAFRHALLDTAYFAIPFPNCWCWQRIPDKFTRAMLDTYRAEVANGGVSVDEPTFWAEYARCRAAWVVYLVGSRFASGLLVDDRDRDFFTERQRIITVLEHFGAWQPGREAVSALAEWGSELARELRSRWRGLNLAVDLYPAFATTTEI
jgi:tRNA A-37 threonylcarbamoyl transferase component Bud32